MLIPQPASATGPLVPAARVVEGSDSPASHRASSGPSAPSTRATTRSPAAGAAQITLPPAVTAAVRVGVIVRIRFPATKAPPAGEAIHRASAGASGSDVTSSTGEVV